MADTPRVCDPHADLVAFRHELPNFTEALYRKRRIKVVAIGSSSTAGELSPSGDVKIMPFPYRLELALRKRYPGRMIDIINRGIIGQEAPEELGRFESDVIGELPAALVIWQVGTNALFHKDLYNLEGVASTIAAGLSWLKDLPIDAILMDSQYAPVLVQDDQGNPDPNKEKLANQMMALIAGAARDAGVNLFPRYALMQQWCATDGKTLPDLVDPADSARLHMSEWATACVTTSLDLAIGAKIGPVPGAPPPSPVS
jgi:hypothetical protein